MNRIILIGNGFDLAHELRTSYRDFMNWYWKDFLQKLLQNPLPYENEFVKLEQANGPKGGFESWIGANYRNDPLSELFISFVKEVKNLGAKNLDEENLNI